MFYSDVTMLQCTHRISQIASTYSISYISQITKIMELLQLRISKNNNNEFSNSPAPFPPRSKYTPRIVILFERPHIYQCLNLYQRSGPADVGVTRLRLITLCTCISNRLIQSVSATFSKLPKPFPLPRLWLESSF